MIIHSPSAGIPRSLAAQSALESLLAARALLQLHGGPAGPAAMPRVLHISTSCYDPTHKRKLCLTSVMLVDLSIPCTLTEANSDGMQRPEDFVQVNCGNLCHDGTLLHSRSLHLCSVHHMRHLLHLKVRANAGVLYNIGPLTTFAESAVLVVHPLATGIAGRGRYRLLGLHVRLSPAIFMSKTTGAGRLSSRRTTELGRDRQLLASQSLAAACLAPARPASAGMAFLPPPYDPRVP